MKYTKTRRWRYSLKDNESVDIAGFPDFSIDFFAKLEKGKLLIFKGYAWDGATGPVFQTDTTKKASLVHDVLLQAIDIGVLDKSYLKAADGLYREIAKSNGMSGIRAGLHYYAMRYLRPLIWDRLPKRDYEKVYSV